MSHDDDAREPDGLDDPRLTAHAMGEAEGPLTPEEQAEVAAIRATAETLRAGFAATPMPSLDQAHRNAILQGLSPEAAKPVPGTVPGSVVKLSDYSGLGTLAATLLLVVGFGIAGAVGGGGVADTSNLYVKSFSAPNYAGTSDRELEWLLKRKNADGTWELASVDGRFNYKSVDIPPDLTVSVTGTLPARLTSLRGVPIRRGAHATGTGGRVDTYKEDLDGGFRVIDGPRKVIVGYGGRTNLSDVTNGLEDGASAGMGNGGVGVAGNSSVMFSSGAFFNDNSDGDYRGRTENIVQSRHSAVRVRLGEMSEEQRAATLAYRRALSAKDSEINLQGSGGGGFNIPRDGGGSGTAMEYFGLQAGAVVNQADNEVRLFNPGTGGFQYELTEDQDGLITGTDSTTASFLAIIENPWIRPYGEAALSTFSIDVDTAGYSIVRRSLMEQNRLPPPGALRVEELVNYFPYSYPGPVGADPFAVHVDAAACPWAPAHRLVRIALKGREVEEAVRPAANLVFLLDVSGSMAQPNKLPLVQKSIAMLTERLTARDRVAMVVYAGQSGLVLPSTPAGDHAPILAALDRLGAGGSTNGGAGIELAYKVAAENFVPGGINRVVLATDGDFNVGVSDPSALVKMVEEKAKSGVFLTALGYGYDNLKDSTLEQLADRGNGNYGYVDNLAEARKVLVEQGMSTLHCIAKDVKIQVEFNPAKVAGYRLVGYENRVLAAQDFADDRKDAGEIGAGHTVTALYEVVPAGVEVPGAPVDELRYQRPGAFSGNAESLVVKLRWKEPEGTVSTPREFPFVDAGLPFESGSDDFRFAAAVAAFGLVLRDSRCAGSANLDMVREIAAGAVGADTGGWRAEFVTLVDRAKSLKR